MLPVMVHETLRLTAAPHGSHPKAPPEGAATISPGFHTFQAFAFAENLAR